MRKLSEAARCAKEIRKILKKAFPAIKFRVTSDTYSMGDRVNVSWANGVSTKDVDKLIKHFEYGSFDGMTDCYNNTNMRGDIPQTKYLFTNREISAEKYEEAFKILKACHADYMHCETIDEYVGMGCNRWDTPRQFISRKLAGANLDKALTKSFITNY